MPKPDPSSNPYAPPASPTRPFTATPRTLGEPSDYRGERRSLLAFVGLTALSVGSYPIIWFFRRTRFLDSLASETKLGKLPSVLVVTWTLLVVTLFWTTPHTAKVFELVNFGANLVVAYRVRDILRRDLARSGRRLDVSSAGVLFFGSLYLQHVMNEASDTPPQVRAEAGPA